MKTIIIDLDNVVDFILFAQTAGFAFVDVQGLSQDILFLISDKFNFPVMIQHSCATGSWKKLMPAGIQMFEATLESV